MPSLPQLTEPLSDGRLGLRAYAEHDIPEILIAYQDDPRMHEHLGEERPPSGAELGRRSERAEEDRQQLIAAALTIVLPGSDDCVGQISIDRIDVVNARAEVRIWLAPQVRGRGLAPRALRLAAEWLARSCEFERIQMLVEPDNQPMLAAARSAGFSFEGVLRGYARAGRRRIDLAVFSLLPSDLAG